MPAIHQPRRPRASPLWQIVHHCWDEFLDGYEEHHREEHGPLDPHAAHTVRAFHRCGDLSAGFTRFQCPDCGHEKLVAFTCKGRHFCPACHMRRVRTTGTWIASAVCREVPHRQFVFTIPRMLRGIFRKRRHLLHKIREWIPDDDPDDTAWFDQSPAWKAPEVRLDDDRILVLE